jgi:glucosamine--fructose-6-phosphate aminotransferase (isomerizing)
MTRSYLDEIFEQPAALRRCSGEFPTGQDDGLKRIRQRIESGGFDKTVLTGMGASLHGCYPLYLKLSKVCSTPVVLWDASELAHFLPQLLTEKTLLIAVSQSGESAELRRIAERKERPGLVVSITNGEANTLARWADVPLLTRAGAEAAVSSKTYTAGLAVLRLLGSVLAGEDLEAARKEIHDTASELEAFLQGLDEQAERLADRLGIVDFLAFVGRGPSLASARAGSLITQEASKLPCAAYSGGGFRHGPLELARPGFRAVIFAGLGGAAALNLQLAGQICEAGGRVLLISSGAGGDAASERMAIVQIPAVEPALLPILEIVPVQLLTIPLARAKGYEPAVFERASKITAVE